MYHSNFVLNCAILKLRWFVESILVKINALLSIRFPDHSTDRQSPVQWQCQSWSPKRQLVSNYPSEKGKRSARTVDVIVPHLVVSIVDVVPLSFRRLPKAVQYCCGRCCFPFLSFVNYSVYRSFYDTDDSNNIGIQPSVVTTIPLISFHCFSGNIECVARTAGLKNDHIVNTLS